MWRAAAALAILLAVLLPPKLWRAGLEETIWLDETYSLVLTTHPVPELLRRTLDDAHPPLYYLALKAWLRLGRVAGVEPGILWARSMNLLLWTLAAATALLWGRRRLGASGGTLFAWAVAGGAAAAQMAHDARSYGIAFPALVVCFVALVEAAALPTGAARRRAAAVWAIYAVAATTALWSHLLSGLLLASLGAVWLALVLPGRRLAAGFLAAQVAALLLFLPWLVRVPHQWALIQEAGPTWMTPATVKNLLFTLLYWLPFGRLGTPTAPPFAAWLPLGAAAIALPLLGAAAAGRLRGRNPGEDGPGDGSRRPGLRLTAVLGLGGTLLFVLVLWALDRTGLAHAFHGPRYPLLAAGPWAGGLAALALGAARRRTALAWLLAAPWLAAGLVGQVWAGRLESRGGLAQVLAERLDPGAPLYVAPPELIPFFRGELRDRRVHRIEALPCHARERPAVAARATVLDLNPWPAVERPADRLARRLIENGSLARRAEAELLSQGKLHAALYRLEGLRPAWSASLCRSGFRLAGPPVPSGAPAAALPRGQRRADGWGHLELGPELRPWRWGVAEEVALRFHGELAPGRYVLHVVGAREPFPTAEAEIAGALATLPLALAAPVGPGPFHLAVPVTLEAPLRDPVLHLRHPLWSPAERLGADDPRRLSFQLHGAWFEPAGEGP